MNWEHFRSITWLRWRLAVNRWKRAGTLNGIIMIVIMVSGVVLAGVSFFLAMGIGTTMLPKASPEIRMLIWDGIVVAFVSFWMIGLTADLQRDDALSLENLLHFPISLSGAFLLNYVTSLVSFSLILFVPVATGLLIATALVDGPGSLVLLLLLAAFLLMITGVTYQFRGWLAILMANKRRRRAITTAMLFMVVAMAQLPGLANLLFVGSFRGENQSEAIIALTNQLTSDEIDHEEYLARHDRLIEEQEAERNQRTQSIWDRTLEIAGWANAVLPIGWLPYGVRGAAQGIYWPALLGIVGCGTFGSLSLWRAYGTTVRFYTRGGTTGQPKPPSQVAVETKPVAPLPARQLMVERKLPPFSEHVAAIAWTNLRMLIRAPESKMILASPIFMVLFFGSMMFTGAFDELTMVFRPLAGLGILAFTMMGMAQLLINQFGFDRTGFRAYVLAPAPRAAILLGKNLSLGLIAMLLGSVCLLLVQFVAGMRVADLVAMMLHLPCVFLLLCLLGNWVSIFAPVAMKSGGMQAAKPTAKAMLIQIVAVFTFPLTIVPASICLAIGLAFEYFAFDTFGLLHLTLAVVLLAIVVPVYRVGIRWEGGLLLRREKTVLEVVTKEAD